MDSLGDPLLQEILHPQTADKLDASKILELCHRINDRKTGGGRMAVRAAKSSLFAKDPVVQLRALTLLDALARNCADILPDFAAEHVVDDLVKVIHGMSPVANQDIAKKLVTQFAERTPQPSVEQYEQTCRKGVQGLLKDLTSSPQNEAFHLQKWLEGFSNKLLSRADGVTEQVQGLLESTGAVELELHNVFNSFRGLSSCQFVENLVFEEEELEITNEDLKKREQLEITNEDLKKREQGMPSQSYEDDIVPRFKEAVTAAWGTYEQYIWKPSTVASSSSNLRVQVPHIIGTEDFMRDNSCGLAEDRSFGFEALDSESDTERDAAEISDARILVEGEWSASESEVADEQIGGFKPSVSAALDFKAMLEAALRSPYIPQKVDAFTRKGTNTNHFDGNLVPAIQGTMPSMKIATAVTTTTDHIQRSVSKEGHGALQSGTSLEPDCEDQIVEAVTKTIPQHAEIQKSRNWKAPSSEKNTTTIVSNDALQDFHASMMSGGLFDDNTEDGDLFGSQSVNAWSQTTRTHDASSEADTHIEKHEKERSSNGELLVPEAARQESELKASSNSKKLSFPHLDETFPASSYAHIHDSLFANESTSSASLRETLPLLRKGLFEDDEDEADNMDLFGPRNDTTSLKEIVDTDFTDLTGNFESSGSSCNSSAGAEASLVDKILKRAGVARGASSDFGNEASISTESGLMIKKPDTGFTNDNIDGLSRQEFTLSSTQRLSKTRRELEEVSSVSAAQVIAQERSNFEKIHGYAVNTHRFPNLKTTHILDEEEVLTAKVGDEVGSWCSASTATYTLTVEENRGGPILANGFKPGETQHQTGNLEALAEHPTSPSEEVTVSINSNEDESGNASTNVIEPAMSSSEKTHDRPPNISSKLSRKLTFLQEQLSLQREMFSSQQRMIPKTQPNIFVDDASEENRLFTQPSQRPSHKAMSEDVKTLLPGRVTHSFA